MKTKILASLLTAAILATQTVSCGYDDYVEIGNTQQIPYNEYGNETVPQETEQIYYVASFYDNRGNNYMSLLGSKFKIEPNKEKQWGYNTDGHWTSWYDTSSVVTITVDGYEVPTCGSTVLFMDSRLEMTPIDRELLGRYGQTDSEGYSVEDTHDPVQTYFGLTWWWYDTHEKGQGGAKIVVIQSQDGYDIGIIEENEITWDVEGRLPKTTRLEVDGMPVYIHRCNFTIIPTKLFEKNLEFIQDETAVTGM